MTFGALKYTVTGLLINDNILPKNDDVVISLLDMAHHHIANKAEALHLLTLNKDENILRLSRGDYLTRIPRLPKTTADTVPDTAVLDLDHELCFASARLIASYVCKDKQTSMFHVREANVIIDDYNSKVNELLAELDLTQEVGKNDNN